MKLVLVGFMGCGKSTVGKLISKKTSLPFIDLDSVIVEREGRTIPEIFREDGEEFFRELERETLISELLREGSFVLSTGGGAPAYRNNMEVINRLSTSVFLYADFETLYGRISGDGNRPLASLDRKKLRELYEKRLPYYRKAHFTVDTTGKTPEEVAEEIISLLSAGRDKPNREGQGSQT